MIRITAMAATFVLCASSFAYANAPQAALNKTVRASFSMSVPAKGSDGSTISGNRQVQRTIYVSSQGRIFNRHNDQEGRNTASKDRGPGVANMRFSGSKLIGVAQHESGATQLVISFSSDYRSCTIDVVAGADGGKALQFKGLNGVIYTTTGKPQISGQSCSVSDGNSL